MSMDKMRNKHILEMARLQEAIERTDSPYLKRDYAKAYKRMKKELAEYDGYRNQGKSEGRRKPNN